MNLLQFLGAVELGMIFALVALGVYLSFRVLDFPDLTVDGSFPMGAAIAAILIVSGMNPWLATLIAFFGGATAGFITAYLNVRFGILSLLASILTMMSLYSINLRIMGRPNISVSTSDTILTFFESYIDDPLLASVAFGLTLVLTVLCLLFLLLRSQFGLGIRAAGANPIMAEAQGVKTKMMILFGISLSNGIVALAGAFYAQSQGFASIDMGRGTIITGLAAVIIGEVFLPKRSIVWAIAGCVIGAVLFFVARAFALNIGVLSPSDLELVTALIVVVAMILPKLKSAAKKRTA